MYFTATNRKPASASTSTTEEKLLTSIEYVKSELAAYRLCLNMKENGKLPLLEINQGQTCIVQVRHGWHGGSLV